MHDKLSYCLQAEICQLIENNNFVQIADYIQLNYKANSDLIFNNIQLRISNCHALLPKFERHLLSLNTQKAGGSKINSSTNLGLPVYVYANDQYKILDKRVNEKLYRMHVGFMCFLMDVRP